MPADHQVHHPVFARMYALLSPSAERCGSGAHRRKLLQGLSGQVIEVGCGNGLNFAYYPPEVRRVLAVEPEAYLRGVAKRAAERSGRSVTVIDGRAERLPVADGTCDAAVTSLVLCSVDDVAVALREIRRVLRPGAELRFYEHVRADTPGHARLQRFLATAWQAVGGGCRPDRETTTAIEKAGFEINELAHFMFRAGPKVPLGLVSPHILGRAINARSCE